MDAMSIPFVPRSSRKLDMERTMKKFKSKLCLYGSECPYGTKVRVRRRRGDTGVGVVAG